MIILILNLNYFIGSAIAIPGMNPTINGCGSYSVQVNFSQYDNLSGFNQCCNTHDVCYNTCNTTKNACDKAFYSCLKNSVASSSVSFLKKLGNIF